LGLEAARWKGNAEAASPALLFRKTGGAGANSTMLVLAAALMGVTIACCSAGS